MGSTAAVIMAAGQSTRMKSELPKVLHDLCGRPMLSYVLDACRSAGTERLIVIVGQGKDQVMAQFSRDRDIAWVEQRQQKGTAHAALCAEAALNGFIGQVLVIAGDMPLVRESTLRALLNEHATAGDAVTLATAALDNPAGYGRILRDAQGKLIGIVEHNDCTAQQRDIREVNPSYYCFSGSKMFEILHRVKPDNAKGEYYITDAVRIALDSGFGAGAIPAVVAEDATGINSRQDLAVVSGMMQRRIQDEWMRRGVTLVDPNSTWIEYGAVIGADVVVYPFTYIDGGSVIAAGSRVGPLMHVQGEVRAGHDPAARSSAGNVVGCR